jgi:hypothetical protein
MDKRKEDIVRIYKKLIKQNDGRVSFRDLKENNISKDMVSHHFGSLVDLDETVRTASPDIFKNTKISDIYTDENLAKIREEIDQYSRFVVVTAVTGANIHHDFYNSLKLYCRLNNAKLLVLAASDPASNLPGHSNRWGTISSELVNEALIMEDTSLNSNLFISTIKMSAKQIDPTTGLGRISQSHGSCIFASPKQRLKAVPVGNNSYPRFVMGTGSITVSNYNTDLYMSQRTAYIAEHDHVLGGLVIEIEDDNHFHFRHFQADAKGCFIDLGTQYCPNYTMDVRPEAFVMGDWHSGETDPQAMSAWNEVITTLKPRSVVFHDLFNGISINHHEEHKTILKAQRAQNGQLSLDQELIGVARDLESFNDKVEKVYVVKSNHDLFLERYLQEAKYVNDPHNHRLALELAIQLLDGHDPLKYGVNKHLSDEMLGKISWLKLDEDLKIAGVQLASHGHQGSNGSRGTSESLEAGIGKAIVGHSHTPEILRGLFRVGTSTKYKLSYNIGGASSWLHTSCLLYSDGSRQLINEIGGKWRLKE